ncbi:MAG: hypothetical protein KGH98_01230 [Candidatus Micrarchaeota archaeon]|nr:hypothetical protein [Candidatus Micrarchaeota archaeon]
MARILGITALFVAGLLALSINLAYSYNYTNPYNGYYNYTTSVPRALSGFVSLGSSTGYYITDHTSFTIGTNASYGVAPYSEYLYIESASGGGWIESQNLASGQACGCVINPGFMSMIYEPGSIPPGQYYFKVVLTDATGANLTSNILSGYINGTSSTTTYNPYYNSSNYTTVHSNVSNPTPTRLSGYVSISPLNSYIGAGLHTYISLSGSIYTGTGPYSFEWYRMLNGSGFWQPISSENGNLTVYDNGTSPYANGMNPWTYYYKFVLTDGSGENLTSNIAPITFGGSSSAGYTNTTTYCAQCAYAYSTTTVPSSRPLSGSITISPSVINLVIGGPSQMVNLTGSVSGGTPPYNYVWEVTGASQQVLSTNNEGITIDAPYGSQPGVYYIHFLMNDSAGGFLESNGAEVIVSNGYSNTTYTTTVPYTTTMPQASSGLTGSISISPGSPSLSIGTGQTDTIGLSGYINGGTAPYYFSWLIENPGSNYWSPFSSTNNDLVIIAPSGTTPGYYGFKFQAVDSAGDYITSSPTYINVYNAS